MVLTLVEICQQSILRTLEESNFHGKVIKDVCKYVPDHLLEPIVEILLEKGAITDAALLAFLVPSRRKVCIRQALKIRNSVLKQIGMNCPNLTILDLSDCSQVSNSVVRAILQGCPMLETIALNRCHRVTDAAFDLSDSLFDSLVGCFSLEAISLQGCPQITGEIVPTLNKNCRKLKYLNLSQCKNVKTAGIQQIFSHDQLRSLDLAFMDDVNDECFLMLPNFQADSKQCMSSQIHKLSLGKSKITDISVIKMSTNFGLTEIKLQFCSGITDVGITALVNNCPLLRVINLSSCKITDRAIVAIATQSRNLRSLDLSWCGDFTDDGLLALIPEYGIERVLEQLNLVWCPQLTDTAVAALAHISSLKSVDISGCSDVSKNTVLLLTASGITVRS